MLVRHSFVGFWILSAVVVATLAAIGTLPEDPRPLLATALTSVVGLGTFVAVDRVPSRVDAATRATLSDSFVADLMMRASWANTPLLVGGVLGASLGEWWVVLIGAVWSVAAQARIVPTAGRIARRSDELAAAGCDVPLVSALRARDGVQGPG